MPRAVTKSFQQRMPLAFQQLAKAAEVAEAHFQDVCDMEFSVQDGELYVLQTRPAKRSPIANLRFALQFLVEGKIAPHEVLRRVSHADIAAWLKPVITNPRALRHLGNGLPAGVGVATGIAVYRSSDAVEYAAKGI